MIKVIITIDSDQILVIGKCHLGVELSMDRIIGEGPNMLIIITNDFRRGNFRETPKLWRSAF